MLTDQYIIIDTLIDGYVNVYPSRNDKPYQAYGNLWGRRQDAIGCANEVIRPVARIHVIPKKRKWIIRATTDGGLTTYLKFRWAATMYSKQGYARMSDNPEALHIQADAHRFNDEDVAVHWLAKERDRFTLNSWITALELVEIWEH